MRELVKLFLIVTIFSALSGGLLAAVQNSTKEQIEYQQLKFVKGPAILEILEGCSNDPLVDRFKILDGDKEREFFVGVFDGKPNTVALETFGKGYGGDVGVVVAVNLDTDEIVGIAVTTHSETPGMGARAKTEPGLREQFEGVPVKDPFRVKADGGDIDSISGATITSQGVCGAVNDAGQIYLRFKDDLKEKVNATAG